MTSKKPPSLYRKWLIGGGIGLVVLLGDACTAACLPTGDKIPANTTIEGVAIDGLHPADAEQRLRVELGTRYEAALTVTDDKGHSVELAPLESSLSINYAGAMKAAGGTGLNSVDVFKTLLGDGPTELPKNVDSRKLREALTTHAPVFQVEGTDAILAFVDGAISHAGSTDSTALDVDATSTSVTEAMKSSTCKAATVTKAQAPTVTSAMVNEAVTDFAIPALSGPITVKVRNKSFQVNPGQIASVITFAAEDGKFVPHINPEQLLKVAAKARTGLSLATGKDAGYTLRGDTIGVVPAEGGQQLDMKGLAEGVAKATTQNSEARTTTVEMIDESAEFSTERAESLKSTQMIGEFTTCYPRADYRNKSLGRAAKLINGKILLPGETFSLNDTLGPRTPANGFTDGYVINDGLLVKESDGGISQAAATVYSTGFFADYEDVEHRPRTLYFDRYPAGRKATIYYGSFDMKFKNNTDYPVCIQGLNTPSTANNRGNLTFRIWSRPTWDRMELTESVKSNYCSGKERIVSTPDREPQAPIQDFTTTWKRLFYKNGEVAKTEGCSWTYAVGNKVICSP